MLAKAESERQLRAKLEQRERDRAEAMLEAAASLEEAVPKPEPLGASSPKEGKEQNRGFLPIKNWRFTIKNGDWTIKSIQILEFKYQDEGFNHEGITPEIGSFTWTDEY